MLYGFTGKGFFEQKKEIVKETSMFSCKRLYFSYLFLLFFLTQCSSKPCVPEGKHRNSQMIEIYKPDGTKQCDMGEEIGLEGMEEELKNVGVEVLGRRKGQDSLFRITVCGTPTGKINVYRIYASDFKKAEELSFELLIKQ